MQKKGTKKTEQRSTYLIDIDIDILKSECQT